MHLPVILRITGILLTLFSLVLVLPVIVAVIYGEDTTTTFAVAFVITLAAGLLLSLIRRGERELRSGDGFLITVLF